MYRIDIPRSEEELAEYFDFRWQILCKPLNFPRGAEKDEYEQVAQHRLIRDAKGNILAVGRIHFNTTEEAQIRHIAVATDKHGKGLGKMLLTALETYALDRGAERLVTNSRETSIAFFKACGFEVESEAPNELGKLKREQMVKRLLDHSSIKMHPIWCDELQKTWHETIPISEQMGIKLHQFNGRTLEVHASLNKNINLHGTMFAGSIFSLATLTGWGMLFLLLKEKQLEGDIVLGDGDIHYHKPITDKPIAICNIESLDGNFDILRRNKKCCLKLQINILDNQTPVAEFKGVYWIIPARKS